MSRTKTTAELTIGDRVRWQTATNGKGVELPLSPAHPGEVITVQGVRPWALTAGPYSGEQARDGRRNSGEPLFEIVISDRDAKRIGARPVTTADWQWPVLP